MIAQGNGEIVKALFDGFNRGDLDYAASVVADDFELVDVPVGMTFRGPQGLHQWLQTWAAAAPGATASVVNIIEAGDWVFSEHTGRGVHSGPLMTPAGTIPPTGKPFELSMAEVYRVSNGKIVEMRAYWDTGTLMRQLGLMP